MWLQGVEEMQEEGWIPNATQWAKIRDKIDNISEAAPEQPLPPLRLAPAPSMAPPMQMPPPMAMPAGPSSMSLPPAPPQAPNPLLGNGNLIRTPDIDTSGKKYESGFV